MKPADLLQQWLEARLPEAGRAWLEAALAALRGPNAERELGRNVSLASQVGRAHV